MPQRYAELLAAWRAADRRARDAEKALQQAYAAYIAGSGPEPTEEMRKAVADLRHQASACLTEALNYAGRPRS